MEQQLQAIATILSLVNPVMCATIFLHGHPGAPMRSAAREAGIVVGAVTLILVVAAIAGTVILDVFGISMNAFACAGGGILVWIGAGMLRPAAGDAEPEAGPRVGSRAATLGPLILFAASPGTITGVLTVSAVHSAKQVPITALVAIGVTATVLLVALLAAAWLGSRRKTGGLGHQLVTSYMGLIVIAMGLQFALTGFRNFMRAG